MPYQCLIINDSGSVEFTTAFTSSAKPNANAVVRDAEKDFQIDPPVLELEMYDDPEFNRLNDLLHGPTGLLMNDRAKAIFESFQLPDYRIVKTAVCRIERKLGFFKVKKEYQYHWLYFSEKSWNQLYECINFDQSEIEVYEGIDRVDVRIEGVSDVLKLRASGRSFTWKPNKIVLTNEFDSSLDLFRLPMFSWMTYVSDRLREKLLEEEISDIKFVDTGIKSRLEGVKNPLIVVS